MKKLITPVFILFLALPLAAFEWPVKNIKAESFTSYFAQKRGNTISSSILIEPLPEKTEEKIIPEVNACDEGNILIVISDYKEENDFFPSTLGQAVIISHDDNIISVYGNLALPEDTDFESAESVNHNTKLGEISNNAWTEYPDSLELKIIDTKKQIAVNPRILLPRIEKEKSFPPSEIIAENKDGKRFDLNTNKSFLSGNYKFYQKRNENLVPFQTSLTVNGELLDEFKFSEIIQKDNKVYLLGQNKNYSVDALYPDSKLFLIGETKIAKGKSILTFENINHLDEKRLINISVNVY